MHIRSIKKSIFAPLSINTHIFKNYIDNILVPSQLSLCTAISLRKDGVDNPTAWQHCQVSGYCWCPQITQQRNNVDEVCMFRCTKAAVAHWQTWERYNLYSLCSPLEVASCLQTETHKVESQYCKVLLRKKFYQGKNYDLTFGSLPKHKVDEDAQKNNCNQTSYNEAQPIWT